MQATALRDLGSGDTLKELYESVFSEPDLTDGERADYSQLLAGADPIPCCCAASDLYSRPHCNPAQLLGLTFGASDAQVSGAGYLALCMSSLVKPA